MVMFDEIGCTSSKVINDGAEFRIIFLKNGRGLKLILDSIRYILG